MRSGRVLNENKTFQEDPDSCYEDAAGRNGGRVNARHIHGKNMDSAFKSRKVENVPRKPGGVTPLTLEMDLLKRSCSGKGVRLRGITSLPLRRVTSLCGGVGQGSTSSALRRIIM